MNVPWRARNAPLSSSVIEISDHIPEIRVAVWPPGQSSTSAGAGPLSVSEPVTLPFLPAVNSPLVETSVLTLVFLGSDGTLPLLLMVF